MATWYTTQKIPGLITLRTWLAPLRQWWQEAPDWALYQTNRADECLLEFGQALRMELYQATLITPLAWVFFIVPFLNIPSLFLGVNPNTLGYEMRFHPDESYLWAFGW